MMGDCYYCVDMQVFEFIWKIVGARGYLRVQII